VVIRNGTFVPSNPDPVPPTREEEQELYDALPAPIRRALSDAPMNVSVHDLYRNPSIHRIITTTEPEVAAAWLEENIAAAYRRKLSSSS
jgi:hypothetical protein